MYIFTRGFIGSCVGLELLLSSESGDLLGLEGGNFLLSKGDFLSSFSARFCPPCFELVSRVSPTPFSSQREFSEFSWLSLIRSGRVGFLVSSDGFKFLGGWPGFLGLDGGGGLGRAADTVSRESCPFSLISCSSSLSSDASSSSEAPSAE